MTGAENFGRKKRNVPERDFDLVSVMKASRAIAGETVLGRLMDRLMEIVIENAGAREGFLILKKEARLVVEARVSVNRQQREAFTPIPVDQCNELSAAAVNYVARTGRDIIEEDASAHMEDAYIRRKRPRSLLCIPIRHQGILTGVLYLENSRTRGVFTSERIDVLRAVAEILANAWARQQAEEELSDYQERLRSLSSEVLLAEERERRRIAVGLHDRIGQSLTFARLRLGALRNETRSTGISHGIDAVIEQVEQSIEDTRTLTFELSPPDLYELGIAAALDALSETMLEKHGIAVRFWEDTREKPMDERSRVLLYQAAREILFNIVKHAEATEVAVSVENVERTIRVTIRDNGVGFHAEPLLSRRGGPGGFGLFSVRERMEHHGGSLAIESEPGKGTTVLLASPLSRSGRT